MSNVSEEKHYIPKNEIREHVGLKLLRDRNQPIPELQYLSQSSILKTPITIYDINGKPLFYDYVLKKAGATIGLVRAAASKVLGDPVIRYELGGPKFNTQEAMRDAANQVKRKHPDARIGRPMLVCYSYPKLGAMFTVRKKGETMKVILDLPSMAQVPIGKPDKEVEGAYAWSFYDQLSPREREIRLRRYKEFEDLRERAPKKVLASLASTLSLSSKQYLEYVKDIKVVFVFETGRKLQFCEHYNDAFGTIMVAPTGTVGHHCFQLHAQEKWDYCAVATCQMILCYYRYYYSQDDIAPHLNYHAGGCPSDQSAGYESLTSNHLDATFDGSPTWDKAKTQIDQLKPLKSGISGHARACAGYSKLKIGSAETRSLYIYDPSPWNANLKLGGTLSWENWDSIAHTNYIYTDLQY